MKINERLYALAAIRLQGTRRAVCGESRTYGSGGSC